jgi:hypothetical protein
MRSLRDLDGAGRGMTEGSRPRRTGPDLALLGAFIGCALIGVFAVIGALASGAALCIWLKGLAW